MGVITGGTSADGRQALVDEMTDRARPCVLLSQIVAGGVGLNLQAASVVILCEPQVKPALEDQAVKRAHRMGQVRAVQVHRLLTEDSVDERMLEILDAKSEVFAQYAAHSDVASASPEAVSITDAKVAQQVLAQEQERLAAELRARDARRDDQTEAARQDDFPESVPAPSSRRSETPEAASPMAGGDVRRSEPLTHGHERVTTPRRRFEPMRQVRACNSCGVAPDVYGHCRCSD